ncbi:nuclease-related domain-containing protein [Streptomyces sp. NPDC101062]|uniref:nuclease-related domain-containing protein n=1 Tax=unclassified Streptomyces TaxID=2593676 RepID=UPI002E76558D|nr:nuclease-related domain-containing protein [Streptomyces sp. JV176]MEE1804595.1 nuclease-related domain-containing protein [Streptomyces sp. JV176]
MTRLRVTPGYRRGRDRLYVSRRDGTAVAWYDKGTGRVNLLTGAGREDVLAALAPYLAGEVTVGPAPVPTPAELDRLSLHPDDDLAPNRPGEALHAVLDDHEEPVEGQRRPALSALSALSVLWRRQDPRRAELAAQQVLGAALDALEGAGWRVLHSIPLPGAARIDHLAIGPAGVLTVRTLAAGGRRVRVDDPLVTTGRGEPLPHLRWARRDAERASLALATAVRPVLAVVEAHPPRALPAPPDVRILSETDIPALASLGGVLKPADIETLYATARNRHTWRRV